MIVITICLVFTITKVIVKLLHYNGLYKTKCKLFKVTYCSRQGTVAKHIHVTEIPTTVAYKMIVFLTVVIQYVLIGV